MAQLISMRQRIKTVETIKKITHAMRLISMSTHSRLRHNKVHLENYKRAFELLWTRISPVMTESESPAGTTHLIIVAGSQKGLCGPFNSSLFKFFEREQPSIDNTHHIVAIGKHAIDYFKQENVPLFAAYNNFSVASFVSIAQAVTDLIIASPIPYASVSLYSNYQKNFFIQKPQINRIFPFKKEKEVETVHGEEYLFEQSSEELSATIRRLMLTVTLQELLFDSLLAEQAARFLSMDTSTRNADKLLVSMKLEYNKSRQAAITRELTELAGGFSAS
jgi:F-type H+-transporting ATPase subunit gamma